MKRITTLVFLGIAIISSAQDKKKFFDHIDVMLSFHAGESSMEKDGWGKLIKTPNPAYSIDTFYPGRLVTDQRNRNRIDLFHSMSVGVRVSKTIIRGNEKNEMPERLECRLALLAGTLFRTRAFYSNYDPRLMLPPGEFRYRLAELTYRRYCINLNSHLVYKFRDLFFKRENLLYFIGMGAGITANMDGHTRENLFTYRITPVSGDYVITEEDNMSRLEKTGTRIDPYFTMVMGAEFRCTDRFSFLIEANPIYNGRTYSSGGYLSAVFRFKL